MDSNKVARKVLVIGAGFFSQFHLDAWQRMPGATLAAIVELDKTKHANLSESFPSAEIFAELKDALNHISADIVDIVTPPASHVPIVQTVLSQTEDHAIVICQKPFCTSINQASELAHYAFEKKRKLVVHENFRFQPWYGQIKSLIDNGELGAVLRAGFNLRTGDGRGTQAYLERQPYFQKMPRFLIHETGIHWIDTFRYLFGEPSAVYADLWRTNPHIAGEDSGFFVFSYASGARVTFDGNRNLDHRAENKRFTLGEMIIEGTLATLRLEGDGNIYMRNFGEMDERLVSYQLDNTGFAGDCVFRLSTHIVSHLSLGEPLHNLAIHYLRNLELEELVYQSADCGMRLDCPT